MSKLPVDVIAKFPQAFEVAVTPFDTTTLAAVTPTEVPLAPV